MAARRRLIFAILFSPKLSSVTENETSPIHCEPKVVLTITLFLNVNRSRQIIRNRFCDKVFWLAGRKKARDAN
jgi:hypothetical protein